MINKLQTENIKAFEPKAACVKELHNHTHELMKRLVWSSRCNSWFKMGKKNGPVTAVYPGYALSQFENISWPYLQAGDGMAQSTLVGSLLTTLSTVGADYIISRC